MKGIVLAGGLGTRLHPLTKVTNKHLLPVYNKPMIYYPLNSVKQAGCSEAMVVIGGPFAGHFVSVLKNGEEFGFNRFQYGYQEDEGGIAEALSLTEEFAGGEGVMVFLGDNVLRTDLSPYYKKYQHSGKACVFAKKVDKPNQFGVVKFDEEGKVIAIEEKPKIPPSNYAVIGVYMYPGDVYSKIRKLDYSARGELEVTDLNNLYIREGRMDVVFLDDDAYWSDCGSFESLLRSNLEIGVSPDA
tara:strand:- start:1695 stop:2423 length:729 start_codon:yes stop_codon:yes gene_type:complete